MALYRFMWSIQSLFLLHYFFASFRVIFIWRFYRCISLVYQKVFFYSTISFKHRAWIYRWIRVLYIKWMSVVRVYEENVVCVENSGRLFLRKCNFPMARVLRVSTVYCEIWTTWRVSNILVCRQIWVSSFPQTQSTLTIESGHFRSFRSLITYQRTLIHLFCMLYISWLRIKYSRYYVSNNFSSSWCNLHRSTTPAT